MICSTVVHFFMPFIDVSGSGSLRTGPNSVTGAILTINGSQGFKLIVLYTDVVIIEKKGTISSTLDKVQNICNYTTFKSCCIGSLHRKKICLIIINKTC